MAGHCCGGAERSLDPGPSSVRVSLKATWPLTWSVLGSIRQQEGTVRAAENAAQKKLVQVVRN